MVGGNAAEDTRNKDEGHRGVEHDFVHESYRGAYHDDGQGTCRVGVAQSEHQDA